MLNHLLVPLKESDSAESVLPMVRSLDRLGVSEITLLRAELPIAADEFAVVSDAALISARRELEAVRRRLAGVQARVRVLARIGPTVSTILEVARECGATLIVASAARRSRLSRFLFGSVTERLLQLSRIPLLSVPTETFEMRAGGPAPGGRPPRTVLLPLDGSPLSRSMLGPAMTIALATGARILLLRVLPQGRDPADCGSFEDAEEQLYDAGAECAGAGVDFSVLIDRGDPAERILEVCRERRVDWIAMTTRGRSSLWRWLRPGATLRVRRQADLPMLTVRVRPEELGRAPAVRLHQGVA